MRRAMLTATATAAPAVPASPTSAIAYGLPASVASLTTAEAPTGSGGTMYAICMANTSGQTWTAPGGWTTDFTDSTRSIAVFEAPGVAAGTSLGTFTRSATSTGFGVVIVRVTGAGTFQVGGSQNATGDLTLPSVTVTGSNVLLLQVVIRIVVASVTWTPPGGTTALIDGTTSGTAYEYSVGSDVASAGASGTRLWDQSGVGGATRGVILAINPV